MNVPDILKKLKKKGDVTSIQRIKIITYEFLINEGFLHLADNVHSIKWIRKYLHLRSYLYKNYCDSLREFHLNLN